MHADTHTGSATATADESKAGNHLTEINPCHNTEAREHPQPIPMKISIFSSSGIHLRHTTQLSNSTLEELAPALQKGTSISI